MLRRTLLALVLVGVGCHGANVAGPAPAPAATVGAGACDPADRNAAAAAYAEGRLEATLRWIDRADAACPAQARVSAPLAMAALAALGRHDVIRARAPALVASGDPELVRAGQLALAAASAPLEDGRMLLARAQQLLASRNLPQARATFARALTSLEAQIGNTVRTGGATAPYGEVVSVRGGLVALAQQSEVVMLDEASFTPVIRLRAPSPAPHAIRRLALSPDGSRVAVSYERENEVVVFDVRAGRVLRVLNGHTKVVTGLDFAGDARTVVSCGEDDTLRIWDVDTGATKHVLPYGFGAMVAASPKGDLVAVGGYQESVAIYSARSGRRLRTMPTPKGTLARLDFSADGKQLAVGGYDMPHASTLIYDVTSGRKVRVFSTVGWPALSPDGRYLAGATEEHTEIYDLSRGTLLAKLEQRLAPSWTRAGALLVLRKDGSIEASDPRGQGRQTVAPAPRFVNDVAFGPASRLAYLSKEAFLGVCDLAHTLACREMPTQASAFAYDPRGNWFATVAAQSGDVDLLDATFQLKRHVAVGGSWAPSSIAVTPDGKHAFVRRNFLDAYDMELGLPVKTVMDRATGLPLPSPDGREMATVDGKQVSFRDPSTGQVRRVLSLEPLTAPAGVVTKVAYSPDGRRLAAGRGDRLALFDVNGPLIAVAQIPLHYDKKIGAGIKTLAFDPAGQHIAVLHGGDPAAQIFEVPTLRPFAVLAGQKDHVYALDYRSDGAVLATATSDGLRLWSASGGLLATLGVLEGDGAYLRSPDGTRVEVFGSASRWLDCEIGPYVFPFALCEDRVVTRGLLPP